MDDQGTVLLGHLASWWVMEDTFDGICGFLEGNFNGFSMRERQSSRIRAEISQTDEKGQPRRLATLFGAIEAKKAALRIQEYSIAQTSLEQIFNQFAAQQQDDDGVHPGCCGNPKCRCDACDGMMT